MFLQLKFVELQNGTKEDNGSAVTIEADGPSDTFKDEVSKVSSDDNFIIFPLLQFYSLCKITLASLFNINIGSLVPR